MWKDVVGFEGRYMVSDNGELKGKRGFILKQRLNTNGYPIVTMRENGRPRDKRVHRIVAEAFIPNPNNLPFVNHIDGDKQNNSVENLEWCSQSHNIKEAYRMGLSTQTSQYKAIHKIDPDTGEILDTHVSITAAVRSLGIDDWSLIQDMIGNISACAKGRKRTAYKYKWRYV